MRTDVKIGLVCALVIVMGALVYFIANSGPKKPGAATPTSVSNNTTASPDVGTPATAPAASGSMAAAPGTGAVGGGVLILPPSPTAAAGGTPGGTAPLSATDVPTTPSMGAPAGTGTTATPGVSGTPAASGTTGTAGGTGTAFSGTGFGTPSTGTPSAAGSASTGAPRSTIEFGGPRADSFPGPSTPSFGSAGFASPASATAGTTYTIQKGDMLGTIARQFNVSVKAIEAANPGIDSTRLRVGKVINIPASSGTASAGGSTPAARSSAGGSSTAAPKATTTVSATAKPGSTYKTKKGDTLVNIARTAYGSDKSWQRIYQANKSAISDPNVVPVGLVIKIPQ